jgi:hypothetical protein
LRPFIVAGNPVSFCVRVQTAGLAPDAFAALSGRPATASGIVKTATANTIV